jgi:hypothetical protein
MKRLVFTVVIGLLLTLALGTTSALATDNSNPNRNCGSCHGNANGPNYAAYHAPAKGHVWLKVKGTGHLNAPGMGHTIHGDTSGDPGGGV